MKKNNRYSRILCSALAALSLIFSISAPITSQAVSAAEAARILDTKASEITLSQIPDNFYYGLIDNEDTRKAYAAYKSLLDGPYLYIGGKMEELTESQLKSYVAQGKAISIELTDKSLTDDDLPTLVTNVFQAINYDNPMGVKSQVLSMSADGVIIDGTLYLGYSDPPELNYDDMQRQTEEEKARIINEIKNDPRYIDDPGVKELLVHDYLCTDMKYDGAAAAGNGDRLYIGHSVYGALIEKNAVCDAISMSCEAILRDLGVDCYVVDGDAHAWNMVNIDGKYYELDCTWDMAQFADDEKTSHQYFNKKTEYMTETGHKREDLSLKLPQADGDVCTFEKIMADMGIIVGDHTEGDFKYELNERSEAVINEYTGSAKTINIPATLNVNGHEYKIIMINDEVFKNSRIQKVTIGKNVEILGEGAFAGCKKLKTVIIKNAKTLDYIMRDSFKGAAKKITFKIHGSKKDCKLVKKVLINNAGVKKGIFKFV